MLKNKNNFLNYWGNAFIYIYKLYDDCTIEKLKKNPIINNYF